MKGKRASLIALTAVFGITIGGAIVGSLSAVNAADDESTRPTPIWEQYLTDEEKQTVYDEMEAHRAEMEQRREEFQTYRDTISITSEKTDTGIQVNITGDNQETIDWMHSVYDENGGEWRGMGMGGRPGGRGPGMGMHARLDMEE
ncbi:MAG TPA: hypothetical protein PKL83_03190 [bacterium]|nr:hypothetical protein [bacterium]